MSRISMELSNTEELKDHTLIFLDTHRQQGHIGHHYTLWYMQ